MARPMTEGIKRTRIFLPICSYQRPSACTGPMVSKRQGTDTRMEGDQDA
jgi:hypothetical protein